MSYDIQLRPRQDNLPDLAENYSPVAVDLQSEQTESIFARLHRLLRGRYPFAIALALILGTAGAYFGFRSKQPQYQSTGMIHLHPYLSYTLTPSDQTGPMPAFASFRDAQIQLLQQERVINRAMTTPEWKAIRATGTSDEAFEDFMRKLKVSAQGGEMVAVSFTDPDRRVCEVAVKGVLDAYHDLYIAKQDQDVQTTIDTLEKMRLAVQSERDAARDAVRTLARETGSDDLRPLQQSKLQALAQLESQRSEIEGKLAALAKVDPVLQAAPTTGPVARLPRDMTPAEIAMVDPRMRQMMAQYQDTRTKNEIQLAGKGPNHPSVVEAKAYEAALWRQIETYADEWRGMAVKNPDRQVAVAVPVNTLADQRAQLEAARDQYTKLIEGLQVEIKALGLKILDIERRKLEEQDKTAKLAELTHRIETLRTESKPAARVEIVSEGDRTMMVKDSRLQFSILGGGFGVFVGFGLVALVGLIDRRYRSLDDARKSSRLPLLGILPELPDDLAEPEQASIAAHCVHQIRTLLQIGQGGEARRVFAVTSPAAGTGKTSLTLAMGVSFAAANSKTLIIDCDVVGGGLTARVETIIRRKIGQIFKREGKITQQQLETALRLAHNSQKKLGEILVDLGYLSPDDVDRALSVQDESPVGMLDAMAGDSIDDCVAETGIQGLYVLPVGAALPSDVSKLSPNAVRDVLARARERFDIIIIDTGPVPGSLEASAVAAAVDGVVMVVSRGEHRPLAEKSIQHLHDIGARLAGMVFNRADSRDMEFASTTTRMTSYDRTGRSSRAAEPEPYDPRFGPVASAVAHTSPQNKNASRQGQK